MTERHLTCTTRQLHNEVAITTLPLLHSLILEEKTTMADTCQSRSSRWRWELVSTLGTEPGTGAAPGAGCNREDCRRVGIWGELIELGNSVRPL